MKSVLKQGETVIEITAQTQLLGVIGHPIAQSKSPHMHNAALAEQQLPYKYFAFDVHPNQLPQAVRGMRAIGARGWNVTIPHKVSIMSLLDEVSDDAQQIGAVNTIVNEGGKLYGFNTDGAGYLQSLQEETGLNVREQRILLIGAGGAARGVSFTLAQAGADNIIIANRTEEKAAQLRELLSPLTDVKAIRLDEMRNWITDRTLIINTTAVGMHPNTEVSPLCEELLPQGVIVSDLIYNPAKTLLLRQAEQRGCVIHNGLGMFVHQGALAYEKWTGVKPPLDVMRRAVMSQDGREENKC